MDTAPAQTAPFPAPPVVRLAATALVEAATYASRVRADLHVAAGDEGTIMEGLHALDAICDAIKALQRGASEITNTRADLESIADMLHDAAGDVAGWYERQAAEVAA